MTHDLQDDIRTWWNDDAGHYDRSAGHALSDPVEAAAWRAALERALPAPPARVLDVGAGTGSLTLLAAELGHDVTALDISEGMLAAARRKAEQRGLPITFLVGPAEDPPTGPFDAVIERHVVWTLPDPVGALHAWRAAARTGRLALFEGSWAGEGPFVPVKDRVAAAIRWLRRDAADHHHAAYPGHVVAKLPLSGTSSPAPFVEAVVAAGWRRVRIERLRDVEWATSSREPWPLGWLSQRPHYVILADA
jgi:2-polyprenyl-3-methyl-5-hydroxy-6-metoxy-1,4-benzoquinol methylase